MAESVDLAGLNTAMASVLLLRSEPSTSSGRSGEGSHDGNHDARRVAGKSPKDGEGGDGLDGGTATGGPAAPSLSASSNDASDGCSTGSGSSHCSSVSPSPLLPDAKRSPACLRAHGQMASQPVADGWAARGADHGGTTPPRPRQVQNRNELVRVGLIKLCKEMMHPNPLDRPTATELLATLGNIQLCLP